MTIYVICPDSDFPVGAVKGFYQYVDILNEVGYPAYILHETRGFRCTWFENTTKIAYILQESKIKKLFRKFKKKLLGDDVNSKVGVTLIDAPDAQISHQDYLIIPTKGGPHIADIAPGVPKVIFNRGTYYATFKGYSIEKNRLVTAYNNKDVVAVIVVSEDNQKYLNYVFPNIKVYRNHNSMNPAVFKYNKQKKQQICFLKSKNIDDVQQVINILKFRGVLSNFELIPIEKKTQKQIAQIYRESLIFLSFGSAEGFPRPPIEAMMSGCIAIGYHGRGGREYFKPEFCYPIEVGDIIGFASAVEEVIKSYEDDPKKMVQLTQNASNYMLKNYSPEIEKQDIAQTWAQIIDQTSQPES